MLMLAYVFLLLMTNTQAKVEHKQMKDAAINEADVRQVAFSSASASRQVGDVCTFNTDCVMGAFCNSGICQCWNSHVSVEKYCWRKVNPEEPGCSYDVQCDAVWPGATCVFSICRCPTGKVAAATREGPVCHAPGHCPTNGLNSLLMNRNSLTPSQCFFFDGEERRAGRFIGCDDFPEVHECVGGQCCPSRALTCIQPLDSGEMGNGSTIFASRWYFDSVSGSCQQFNFSGIGGNSNNFMTIRQCESYCESRCSRGQPQLDPSPSEADPLSSLTFSCSSDSNCDEDRYGCVKKNALSYCCPKPEFICSEYGGLSGEFVDLTHPPTIQMYSSGSNKLGQEASIRWYWDRTETKCKTFKYLGQGGNFNNFLSEQQCLEYCTRALCAFGSPLRLSSGDNIECSSNVQCPRSHQCSHGVCCPTAVTICNQPLSFGIDCQSEPVQRFWFNAAQGACQHFSYKGCQGNNNKFASLNECQGFCGIIEEEPKCLRGEPLRLEDGKFWTCGKRGSTCPVNFECHFDGTSHGCCPTKSHTCSQRADDGRSCTPGMSIRWYFHLNQGRCRSFSFKGCDGNSNNFPNQRECEDYCGLSGCPNGGDFLRNPSGEPTECLQNASVCPDTHRCTTLIKHTDENSSKFCCPSRLTICSEDYDGGRNCSESVQRYFFDRTVRSCRPFTFNGCGGNGNNFVSRTACANFCQSSACASSEIVFHSQSSDFPFDCSQKSCPKGFICVIDPLDREKKVCCGSSNFGVCPSEQRPFLDHRTQKPQSCSPQKRNGCPSGFFCSPNNERNSYYCCAQNANPPSCPEGSRMVRNEATSDPLGCSSDSQCPIGKCHNPEETQTGVCCAHLDNVCPPDFRLDKERTDSGECSPLSADSCSVLHNSVCLFSEKMKHFVCCLREEKKISTVPKCPANTVEHANKLFCSTELSCPNPFFCVRKENENVGMCCRYPKMTKFPSSTVTSTASTTSLTTDVQRTVSCSRGDKPLIDVRSYSPMQCNSRFPCPAPYECKPSFENLSVRICCEVAVPNLLSCPTGSVPLSIDGRILSCRTAKCPNGYECVADMCCPKKEFSCSEPLFVGTKCDGEANKPSMRVFYDVDLHFCRKFEFRGCNPNANHFVDQKSCERVCVEGKNAAVRSSTTLSCPSPFQNPTNSPQLCSPHFESCDENQKCMETTSSKQHICCIPSPPVPPQSLKTLIGEMCGSNRWKPSFISQSDRQPRRCSSKLHCERGSACKYSSVLMLDICCEPTEEREEDDRGGEDDRFASSFRLESHNAFEDEMKRNGREEEKWMLGRTSISTTRSTFSSRIKNGKKWRKCNLSYGEGDIVPEYCKRKVFPGESGCDSVTSICSGQSRCVGGLCVCNRGAVLYERMCYWKCPPFFRNVSGICV